MMRSTQKITAAIFVMAVLFIGLIVSGCCTSRDIGEVKARLDQLEQQNRQVSKSMAKVDSLVASGADADTKLRNEIRFSVSEMQEQMQALLTNYNELMQRIDNLAQKQPVIHTLKGSPGASTDQPTTPTEPPPSATQYAINCDSTYDESFIRVRKSEYEKAIEGFESFLNNCPNHESTENAHYWIGECYYALEKYNDAITQFDTLIKDYPNSVNLGRALYKLARCHQELGNTAKAKEIFERLVKDYAGTLEGEQAKERLKDFK